MKLTVIIIKDTKKQLNENNKIDDNNNENKGKKIETNVKEYNNNFNNVYIK